MPLQREHPQSKETKVGVGREQQELLTIRREMSEQQPQCQDFIVQMVSNGHATSSEFKRALTHIQSFSEFTLYHLASGIAQIASAYREKGQVEFKQGDLKDIFRRVTGKYKLSIRNITVMLRTSGVLEPLNPQIGNAGSRLTQRFIESIAAATEQKNPYLQLGVERGPTSCDFLPLARQMSDQQPQCQDFIVQMVSNARVTSEEFNKALTHIQSFSEFSLDHLAVGIAQIVSAYCEKGQVEFKQGDLKDIFRRVTGNHELRIQNITIMLRTSGVLEPLNPQIRNAGSRLTQRFIESIAAITEQKAHQMGVNGRGGAI